MDKQSIIRTVYLYIFALLGLVLMTIGGVSFVNMGLKAFVFTKADQEQNFYMKQPPSSPIPLDKIQDATDEKQITLSDSQKAALEQWLADYKNWQDQNTKIDPLTSQRHRDASLNLALILIGLPLYLYHCGTIKKETKIKVEQIINI